MQVVGECVKSVTSTFFPSQFGTFTFRINIKDHWTSSVENNVHIIPTYVKLLKVSLDPTEVVHLVNKYLPGGYFLSSL